jgi:hypothetical protein
VPWRALGAGGALGLLLAGMPRLFDGTFDAWWALTLLRAAVLAFALGLAFLLDDPARHTTATVPVRRPVRQALRAALVAPFAALWWTAALLLVPAALRPPTAEITLEAAGTVTLALATAAMAVRFTQRPEPGQAVAGALLIAAVLTALLLPARWALFVGPGDDRWAASHDRWAVLLAAAGALGALCGPEPVRRRGMGDPASAAPDDIRRPGRTA